MKTDETKHESVKRHYNPPEAQYIPLKMEERLLSCALDGNAEPPCDTLPGWAGS